MSFSGNNDPWSGERRPGKGQKFRARQPESCGVGAPMVAVCLLSQKATLLFQFSCLSGLELIGRFERESKGAKSSPFLD
jgi:hypothetical protein